MLFLDDIRDPKDVSWVTFLGKNLSEYSWDVVRSFDEAVEWVNINSYPDVVSFDHDLANVEYGLVDGRSIIISEGPERSGMDFAKWLVQYDMDTQLMPAHFRYVVHSMNPIGGQNISHYLNNYISHRGNIDK